MREKTPRTDKRLLTQEHGQTLNELLVIVLVLACACVGAIYALRFAEGHGCGWRWLAAIGGFIGGIVAGIVVAFLLAILAVPITKLHLWWRPYPPPCESGSCVGSRDYEVVRTPEGARTSYHSLDPHPPGTPGISPVAWRCKCGGIYASAHGRGMTTRWVRILPDGTVCPYLRHDFWGRWEPDEDAGDPDCQPRPE